MVNTASVYGMMASTMPAFYSIARVAVVGLSASLRAGADALGARVSAIVMAWAVVVVLPIHEQGFLQNKNMSSNEAHIVEANTVYGKWGAGHAKLLICGR